MIAGTVGRASSRATRAVQSAASRIPLVCPPASSSVFLGLDLCADADNSSDFASAPSKAQL